MSFPWKGRTCANQHFWGGSKIGAKKAGMDLLLGYEGEWIWEIRNLCENPRRDLTSKRGSPNPHHKSQGWWLVRVCWALRCTCCWVFKRSPGNSNDPLKVVCRSGDGLNKSHKWNSLFTFGISGAVRWDPKDKVWLWRQQLFSHSWRGPLPSQDMLLRLWKQLHTPPLPSIDTGGLTARSRWRRCQRPSGNWPCSWRHCQGRQGVPGWRRWCPGGSSLVPLAKQPPTPAT